MEGFFAPTEDKPTRKPLRLIPACGSCGLYRTCNTPKMPVSGRGERGILIVGEAPGADEDEKGIQFVGKTGQRLRSELRNLDINTDRDCWLTNALICRPPNNKVEKEQMVEWCRPNIVRTIAELHPKVVILLGGKAIKSVIGWLWREDVGEVNRWAGWNIPSQEINAWVCPTFHPSYVEREENQVLDRYWARHLHKAVSHHDRPWPSIKHSVTADHVEIELDAKKAATTLLKRFNHNCRPVAFDLETNMLKPDRKEAAIWSCAVSDGQMTIAYPWQGEAVKATLELLWNKDVPKIGYNMKFDGRWIRTKYGKGVRNWLWCGMTGAHVLDSRPLITSLAFQAFVLLGEPEFKDSTQKFLESEGGGNSLNRIKEAPLNTLLIRNGMDALLEYRVAMKQMKEIG